MKIAEITLEVITPMLSFGDNTKKSEFRITELKSLMRNTFREIYSFNDRKDMKEKEDALFGSIEKKSPMSIKIKSIELRGKETVFMLPHKTVRPGKKIGEEKAETSCLGSSSEIVLYMITSNDSNIELYINLLIQASIIGSMGKRSRKGFGSFKITDIVGVKNNKYKDILNKSPIEVLKECDNDSHKIREIQYESNGIEKLSFNDPILKKNELDFPYIKKLNFIKIQEDKKYLDLIYHISELTHDRLPSKKIEEDFIASISNKGLINRNILGNCRFQSKSISRFASPICVSFWENRTDRYMVIKELNYDYILNKLEIKDAKSKKANEDYIQKYIDELVNKGGLEDK
ncbi:type III-B CRISPR module RAMP protein Cmr1 [Clostridium amazonitimonense]|uniref:type III-B CRISPR module RAMP protein Cmr1 n=1 Tax=Clostridium amazonitimonense TaxID=1499689 RepID=UPI000509FBAF|nr:type III-B CRISPR module RAMP protein Cmr1 [Clostridium amazonitimonense]